MDAWERDREVGEAIERALIGQAFRDPGWCQLLGTEPIEIFGSEKNRIIAQTLIDMWRDDREIDPFTVKETLADVGKTVTVEYILDMIHESFVMNFEGDLAILKKHYRKRRVRHVLAKLQMALNDAGSDPDDVTAEAITELSKVIEPDKGKIETFGNISDRVIAIAKSGGMPEPLATGFSSLDLVLSGGLRREEVAIVAGRPSMGKSAFATQLAVSMARKGHKALLFPVEMSADSITMRIIGSEVNIEPAILRNPRFQIDWDSVRKGVSHMRDLNLWIDDDPAATTQKIIVSSKTLAATLGGLDLIVVDYLQALADIPTADRTRYIGTVTKQLKVLARQLGCAVVLVSQLNRGVEQRSERRPLMSDLRDSGEVEQDADTIMLIYREKYYNKTEDNEEAEIIVAKQRNGTTDTVILHWNPTRVRFSSIDKRY